MKANSFGERFVVTTFGESHGGALGCVIDGCPAGVDWNLSLLLANLKRRRPGFHGGQGSDVVSQRNEGDQPEVLSGIFEGKTLGTPIAILVRNQDARSGDYTSDLNRAGHADDVWKEKFGHSDHRGGGRSSGRETVARVLAGSTAQMLMAKVQPQTRILTYISRVGKFELTEIESEAITPENLSQFSFPFPSSKNQEVVDFLRTAQAQGESYGGTAEIRILNPPKNLGQPVFRKLKSDLAQALMSVGAATAVELGDGDTEDRGTVFHGSAESANYGGIRGGISTGEDILLRVHFKPTSSVMDVAKKGRHDPCIVPRALPVLESMCWLVLAEHWLWSRTDRIEV